MRKFNSKNAYDYLHFYDEKMIRWVVAYADSNKIIPFLGVFIKTNWGNLWKVITIRYFGDKSVIFWSMVQFWPHLTTVLISLPIINSNLSWWKIIIWVVNGLSDKKHQHQWYDWCWCYFYNCGKINLKVKSCDLWLKSENLHQLPPLHCLGCRLNHWF